MKGRYYIWLGATASAYILGIATGILAVKEYMRRKYKTFAEKEISSVREAFRTVQCRIEAPKESEPKPEQKPEITPKERAEYRDILHSNGYLTDDIPYVIEPDEFGDLDGYGKYTLTWYSDSVLADENDYEIDDVCIC